MSLWEITDQGPTSIPTTELREESVLEEHLEDWIVEHPSLLGEPLLIIGRQVLIPDTRDRLDVLALDPSGNAVIIELKRGALTDPVDVQALRYASYIAKWTFDDFESQARNFRSEIGNADFNFNALYESFCEDEVGGEDIPTPNQDQRIIIVGAAVREKLGSVALWLRDHHIDITVIEVSAYKQDDRLLIQPSTIVPMQAQRFKDTGRISKDGTPWAIDGKSWHLDKRCSPKTRRMFNALRELLEARFDLDGPRWNQKQYVTYRVNNSNWMQIATSSKALRLTFLIKPGSFDAAALAERLGVARFDPDESRSSKLELPSSVTVVSRNPNSDRLTLRVKDDFDLDAPAFAELLDEVHDKFKHRSDNSRRAE